MVSEFNVLGLMSGTSVDGLDIALCIFSESSKGWELKIEKAETVNYDPFMKERLHNAHLLDPVNLKILDNDFAEFISLGIIDFLNTDNRTVKLIASHGHTVFHRPDKGFTLQIGNGGIIAKRTNIPVVYDFRSGDVALGGQGAPLVPIGDSLLFSEYSACLNLGGFSNISYNDEANRRIAYDICPVNIVLNRFARELGYDFDHDGRIASSGKTDINLLKDLNNLRYYKLDAPKSLGREWVEKEFLVIIEKYKNLNNVDILNTITIHISEQIAKNLKSLQTVLVTGGGTYNRFLINNILSRTDVQMIIPDAELVNFKEAAIFAFLGLLRYLNKINCLSSVTGASRDSCSGILCVP